MDRYIDGRLGLIFDTTSAKSGKIKAYKKMLDALGYEYKMVYVNTSLENAQKRNASRARKLPAEIVKNDWDAAQKNVKDYRSIFGKNFIEIRNDDDLKSLQAKTQKLFGKLMSWSTALPGNKVATAWKHAQLNLKKR